MFTALIYGTQTVTRKNRKSRQNETVRVKKLVGPIHADESATTFALASAQFSKILGGMPPAALAEIVEIVVVPRSTPTNNVDALAAALVPAATPPAA